MVKREPGGATGKPMEFMLVCSGVMVAFLALAGAAVALVQGLHLIAHKRENGSVDGVKLEKA